MLGAVEGVLQADFEIVAQIGATTGSAATAAAAATAHEIPEHLLEDAAAPAAVGTRQDQHPTSMKRAHAAAPENSFKPTIPATISRMHTALTTVAGSPWTSTPTTAAPTAPMPVHTA